MGQLEHFLKNPGSGLSYKSCLTVTDADARGEGGRLNADKGGQKLSKFCGRLLWMAPNRYILIAPILQLVFMLKWPTFISASIIQ